jgi:hypothetical protein
VAFVALYEKLTGSVEKSTRDRWFLKQNRWSDVTGVLNVAAYNPTHANTGVGNARRHVSIAK